MDSHRFNEINGVIFGILGNDILKTFFLRKIQCYLYSIRPLNLRALNTKKESKQ